MNISDKVSPQTFFANFIQALKGAPISCLMVLEFFQIPLTIPEIATYAGYTHTQVRRALFLLRDLDFVEQHTPTTWCLTTFYRSQPYTRPNPTTQPPSWPTVEQF
jgi:hypothetical protein